MTDAELDWNQALGNVQDRITMRSAMEIRVPTPDGAKKLKGLLRLQSNYRKGTRTTRLFKDMVDAD